MFALSANLKSERDLGENFHSVMRPLDRMMINKIKEFRKEYDGGSHDHAESVNSKVKTITTEMNVTKKEMTQVNDDMHTINDKIAEMVNIIKS